MLESGYNNNGNIIKLEIKESLTFHGTLGSTEQRRIEGRGPVQRGRGHGRRSRVPTRGPDPVLRVGRGHTVGVQGFRVGVGKGVDAGQARGVTVVEGGSVTSAASVDGAVVVDVARHSGRRNE
ncbi:hypothetical protein GW17_00038658, partial [Ensete ventricosum]